MPFIVEGRMDDQDNFPNNFLSYSWSVTAQPMGSTLLFLSTNSVTPTLLVDTAGDYTIALAAFDGEATTTATYQFTANAAYGASAYLSGSCATSGSGISAIVQAVYTNATSIISQSDAQHKANNNAVSALTARLNCCPASFKLSIPADAPSGSVYRVTVIPADANPHEDFGLDAGYGSFSFSYVVGSGVSAGSTVEIEPSLPIASFSLNEPFEMEVSVQELNPITGTLFDATNFDLAVTAQTRGIIPGVTSTKVQKQSTYYAPTSGGTPNPDRSLAYSISVPYPRVTQALITVSNRMPPLSTWMVDMNGWDWVVGSTTNALGLFVLTGGTLASPTSETLIAAMNTTNSEPSLLNSYYNFLGYSQIPYQGSIYGYNDRRAFSSFFHTGFINTTPSTVQGFATFLTNWVKANPSIYSGYSNTIYAYFRAGVYSSGTYTWTASSVPLNIEQNQGALSIGSLTASGSILAANNSVLIIGPTAWNTKPYFFATVQGAPACMVDMFRYNTGFPSADSLGVYLLNQWTSPTAATLLQTITPGTVAGRGYDITNLATNATVKSNLATNGYCALAFYLQTAGTPIANSFPLSINNLTNYTSAYSIQSAPSGMTGSAPASTNNVLLMSSAGAKVYVTSVNT